jgi:hypothetical protein
MTCGNRSGKAVGDQKESLRSSFTPHVRSALPTVAVPARAGPTGGDESIAASLPTEALPRGATNGVPTDPVNRSLIPPEALIVPRGTCRCEDPTARSDKRAGASVRMAIALSGDDAPSRTLPQRPSYVNQCGFADPDLVIAIMDKLSFATPRHRRSRRQQAVPSHDD